MGTPPRATSRSGADTQVGVAQGRALTAGVHLAPHGQHLQCSAAENSVLEASGQRQGWHGSAGHSHLQGCSSCLWPPGSRAGHPQGIPAHGGPQAPAPAPSQPTDRAGEVLRPGLCCVGAQCPAPAPRRWHLHVHPRHFPWSWSSLPVASVPSLCPQGGRKWESSPISWGGGVALLKATLGPGRGTGRATPPTLGSGRCSPDGAQPGGAAGGPRR